MNDTRVVDYMDLLPRQGETTELERFTTKLRNDPTLNKIQIVLSKSSCVFDNLRPEDRMKPMGISCPCPKCTPYSMG